MRKTAEFLCAFEVWLVALGVGASIVAPRLLPLAVAAAAVYWGVRWLAYGRLSRRTPADWAVALLLLMLPVTLWVTPLPEKTLPQVYRLLSGVGLYYAIVNWATSLRRLRWLVLGVVLAGLGLALIAPVSVEWATDKLAVIPPALYAHFKLLVSDTVHPNVMAGTLVLLLVIPAAVLPFGWRQMRWYEVSLAVAAAGVMAGVMVLSQSRGGLIALGAALLLVVALRWRWGWLFPLGAGTVLVGLFYQHGYQRMLTDLLGNRALGGLEGRLEIWSRGVFIIQDFAFTGVGMGLYQEVTELLYPFFLSSEDVPHAHNLFLQVGVDLGLPGLIAWLAILMSMVAVCWEVYRRGRRRGNGWVAGLAAGLLAAQAALVVHGMTDAVTWGMVRPAPLVWGLWGLAAALGGVYLPHPKARAGEG